MQKGHVMDVLHSLQGHPLGGKQWMKMIDNIKKALERLINRSEWMDAETKKRAIEKSDMIGSMVGFSEAMTDLVCIDKINV